MLENLGASTVLGVQLGLGTALLVLVLLRPVYGFATLGLVAGALAVLGFFKDWSADQIIPAILILVAVACAGMIRVALALDSMRRETNTLNRRMRALQDQLLQRSDPRDQLEEALGEKLEQALKPRRRTSR